MNCYVCSKELVANSGPTWELGKRKLISFGCRSGCTNQLQIDVIFPDNDIIYYTAEFNKYVITASNYSSPITHLYNYMDFSYNSILKLDRFYELSYEQDLKSQITTIMDKLKKLIIFS